MRYAASEKLEIIRLVESSHLPVKRTLDTLGVTRPTFYRWYDRYLQRGEAGLDDRKSHPGHVWNRIPDKVRQAMLDMALERPELSPRELAVTFTDERDYFVSEASVYRLLRSHDLITSPAFIVMKAASELREKPQHQTSFGKLILLISKLLAGVGSIYQQFWMTTAATSLLGNCALGWRHQMFKIR